jgi:phage shock protein PspC (stress-responsive transcriptional regulator)
MRKVTTISLNNIAYQVEEEGFEVLRSYLGSAERNLAGNPDRAEILADLEQALGEKCRACLGAHKNVISREEIDRIVAEMGPVVAPGADAAAAADDSSAASGAAAGPTGTARRRLYRLEEGRMWAGVCSGLGAYFGFDPVWVRVAFIVLTISTSGIWLLVYLAMVFIVPLAETAGERAAAHGTPFNAQELIDRVKKKDQPGDLRADRARRRAERRSQHYRGRSYWEAQDGVGAGRPGYPARVVGGLLLPLLTLLSAGLFVAAAIAMLAMWSGFLVAGPAMGAPGAWSPEVMRWVATATLLVVYALVAMPVAAGRRACLHFANGGRAHGWANAWSGLLWLALVGVALLFAWYYAPGLQDMVRGLLGVPAPAGWI